VSNLLFDRFKKIRVIGQGGMGTVYLVEDMINGGFFAIKEIPIKKRDRKLLLREPLLLKKLDHDAIVKVEDIYETDKAIYIIMEYIEGRSLKELLLDERKAPEKNVVDWAIQICDTLEYLHTLEPHPVVYRDIKPSNIIVNKNNKIVLIDFGIACEYRRDHIETAQVALTRGYCAPEQYIEKTFDTRSDIYSLGVTIYHMISGIAPTDNYAKPIPKFDSSVSKEMEYIITKATRFDPDERYQSVFDLKYDLINIDRLNRDLRRLVIKQIIAYSVFFVVYLIFGLVIYFGMSVINQESSEISRQLVADGRVSLHQFSYSGAVSAFEKAVQLNPGYIEAYLGIFDYYLEAAKYDEGINYIRANMVSSSETDNHFKGMPEMDGPANLYLAKYYYKKQNYSACYSSATLAQISDAIDRKEAMFYIALSLINMGNASEAAPFINELEASSYSSDRLNYLYAEKSKMESGRASDAIGFYDTVINNSSDNLLISDAIIQKANIYKNNPDAFDSGGGNSQQLYILALEQGDSSMGENATADLIHTKAKAYEQKADTATNEEEKNADLKLATENYTRLLEMGKSELDLYLDLGTAFQSMEDYDNAERVFSEGAKAHNNFLSYYYLTNVQFEKEARKEKSGQDFNNALKSYGYLEELAIKEGMLDKLEPLKKMINKIGVEV
jgi:serine/threonine-protein kinase